MALRAVHRQRRAAGAGGSRRARIGEVEPGERRAQGACEGGAAQGSLQAALRDGKLLVLGAAQIGASAGQPLLRVEDQPQAAVAAAAARRKPDQP